MQYNGDANFSDSNSNTLTQIVQPSASQASVQSSENPSVFGDSVTFTATVAPSSSTSGLATPTGQVTFYDGTKRACTETLSAGSASYTTSTLSIASHVISVQYSGDTNYLQTTSNTVTQTVNAAPAATLDGEVFNDPNGSGALQSGEGLSGWTIDLLSGPTTVATATTNSSGIYTFTNVTPGTYSLAVVKQSGYVPTVPASGTLPVTAGEGQTINDLNFGEFQTVTLSGEVYGDTNGDGQLDGSESGLSGWTVDLLGSSNQLVASTTTEPDGSFSFTGVGPGSYTIEESRPAGYVQTSSPATYSVTTSSGQNAGGFVFGIYQDASISGELFDDANQDGLPDDNESGLTGWTVDLLNSSSHVIATATTNSNGDYSFTGLTPGTYTVEDVLQTGYIQTAPVSGT